jgi:hypothetical protein
LDTHHAYLLRCWQESARQLDGTTAWRFSLLRVGSDEEPRGFASLDALFAHLYCDLEEKADLVSITAETNS